MHNLKQLLKHDKWVMPLLRQRKMSLFWSIFLNFMMIFSAGALMFVSGFLISRSAQRPSNILIIYVPIVLTRLFGISRPVFRYTQRLVSHNWVLNVVSKTRRALYESVASHADYIRGSIQKGKVLGLLADDLDRLQNLYLRTLFPLGTGIILYLFIVIALGTMSLWLMLFWLLMLAIILLAVPIFSLLMNRQRIQKQKQLQSQLYTDATDAVLGLQDWLLAGRQDDLVASQQTTMRSLAKIKGKSMHFGWWRDFAIQMLVLILVVVTLYWSNHYFAGQSQLINYIAAFTLAIFTLADSFLGVNQGMSEATFYEDSIRRLNDLPEPRQQQKIAQPLQQHAAIQFDQVSFSYGDRQILKQLDLNIAAGEKIAMLGRSGAGKTTLLKLLSGDLQPDTGHIYLNKKKYHDLHPQIAILDQQTYLFDTTIRNNIRMGNLSATQEQIEQAVEQAGLSDLLKSLAQGYDTPMHEAGTRFSGGERQRFALARILLQDAPIVILDEPTVALDPKTEQEVLDRIFKALSGRTIIWVTHHLTGIQNVDHVYFLEDGQFILSGTPQKLAQESPRFQQLLKLDQY